MPLPRSARRATTRSRAKGMGFCLVNNVVVAARHAQAAGRERVLIIDWDVHHGNGTQALVETDPTVRYVSLHQYPWYPGTGHADERGVGNVFNVPRGPRPAALAVRERSLGGDRGGDDRLEAGSGAGVGRVRCHGRRSARRVHPRAGALRRSDPRLRERLPRTPIVGMLEGGTCPPGWLMGAAHLRR